MKLNPTPQRLPLQEISYTSKRIAWEAFLFGAAISSLLTSVVWFIVTQSPQG